MNALQNKNDIVRSLAAIALGEIRDSSTVEGLNKVLINDPDSHVRSNAADALGKIGDNSALTGLQHALKDKDTIVVLAAINAIAAIGNPTMIESLNPLLNSNNEWIVESARTAIDKLNKRDLNL